MQLRHTLNTRDRGLFELDILIDAIRKYSEYCLVIIKQIVQWYKASPGTNTNQLISGYHQANCVMASELPGKNQLIAGYHLASCAIALLTNGYQLAGCAIASLTN